MILKLLLIAAIITAIYFMFFKKKPLSKHDIQDSNDMVACHSCDTYTTIEDSLLSNGKYYCSKECLEKLK